MSHWQSTTRPRRQRVETGRIPFYERTPARIALAVAFLPARLDLLTGRPGAVAGWRRSDDPDMQAVYLLPRGDTDGHLVMVVDPTEASATLLHDVDDTGGYRTAEPLAFDQLRDRMPELAAEIDRLTKLGEVAKAEWLVRLAEYEQSGS